MEGQNIPGVTSLKSSILPSKRATSGKRRNLVWVSREKKRYPDTDGPVGLTIRSLVFSQEAQPRGKIWDTEYNAYRSHEVSARTNSCQSNTKLFIWIFPMENKAISAKSIFYCINWSRQVKWGYRIRRWSQFDGNYYSLDFVYLGKIYYF